MISLNTIGEKMKPLKFFFITITAVLIGSMSKAEVPLQRAKRVSCTVKENGNTVNTDLLFNSELFGDSPQGVTDTLHTDRYRFLIGINLALNNDEDGQLSLMVYVRPLDENGTAFAAGSNFDSWETSERGLLDSFAIDANDALVAVKCKILLQ